MGWRQRGLGAHGAVFSPMHPYGPHDWCQIPTPNPCSLTGEPRAQHPSLPMLMPPFTLPQSSSLGHRYQPPIATGHKSSPMLQAGLGGGKSGAIVGGSCSLGSALLWTPQRKVLCAAAEGPEAFPGRRRVPRDAGAGECGPDGLQLRAGISPRTNLPDPKQLEGKPSEELRER